MDLNEIQNLIEFVAKSGVSEVELQTDDFKVIIKTASENKPETIIQQLAPQAFHAPPASAVQVSMPTAPSQQPPAAPKETSGEAAEKNLVTIKSPMIGTFYRSPGPGKDSFVKVGDEISTGKVVCVIEAMKLFNEIESEVSGKIVEILAEDNSPVEYDQPLFMVDPTNA